MKNYTTNQILTVYIDRTCCELKSYRNKLYTQGYNDMAIMDTTFATAYGTFVYGLLIAQGDFEGLKELQRLEEHYSMHFGAIFQAWVKRGRPHE